VRILVVGSGAREHALAWQLAREAPGQAVFVAPGNPLMRDVATVRPDVAAGDQSGILALCQSDRIDLVVVGPEAPLVDGLADRLAAAGVAVVGPSGSAARLEGSKAYCREVAQAAGVAMARGRVFEAPEPARAFAAGLPGGAVVKVDGLAAGKGVTVCDGPADTERALIEALVDRRFGPAGARVVVEERLAGREASLICLCDATTALALPPARDHKRLLTGDRGPNTGGMGAVSPVPELEPELVGRLVDQVHRPVLAEMARRGSPFRGFLYAGLMLTEAGPRLLEFNVRLGDPEAQAILPRLAVPLAPLLEAAAHDRLADASADLGVQGPILPAGDGWTTAVVLAAPGYPEAPRTGDRIEGLEAARAGGGLVFGAGVTAGPSGEPRTAGGRVLTVVGRGRSLDEAAERAYGAAACVSFPGVQSRQDIGRPAAPGEQVGSGATLSASAAR
jgi:phosphoribosylamine---glycine ligase